MLCDVCGPQERPTVHTICHDQVYEMHGLRFRSRGCGHPLADHTDALKCRTCKVECGIDARPMSERIVREPAGARGRLFDA